MAHDEPKLSFEQPSSVFGTWLGVVLLFAVFTLFVWVVFGAMPRGDQYEEKRAVARMEKLKTVTQEAAVLHTYGWVDKEKGVARIPIERAMELSVAELAEKKPAPAGPIVTPTPAAQTPAPTKQTGPGPAQSRPAAPVPVPAATPGK